MEENKYYTPSITEFHVGFEYEHQADVTVGGVRLPHDHPDSWFEFLVETGTDLLVIEAKLPLNIIRVKYLDKEDIESEGFELVLWDGRYIFRKPTKSERNFEEITELLFNPNNNWVLIYSGSKETPVSDFKTRFAGYIKNKSEFRRILKMIGV